MVGREGVKTWGDREGERDKNRVRNRETEERKKG
jgi:hypothetical protein